MKLSSLPAAVKKVKTMQMAAQQIKAGHGRLGLHHISVAGEAKLEGKAFVDGQLAAEAELMATFS